jgi:aminoglycoside phosphotransferase (APT) family kinase protein
MSDAGSSPAVAALPASVLRAFALDRDGLRRSPAGHLNETWFARRGVDAVVVQRLNATVFADPSRLMANMVAVTAAVGADPGAAVRTVALVAASDGAPYVVDDGQVWRCYGYVEGRAPDLVDRAEGVVAARAFGAFDRALRSLPADALVPTIAGFHDLRGRWAQHLAAREADRAGRALAAQRDLVRADRLVERLDALPERVAWDAAPARLVHNDAKPANLVLAGRRAPCVLDLDTTMPGPLLADIGQLVRSLVRERLAAGRGAPDASSFSALWRGFLAGWDTPLDPPEVDALAVAGLFLSVENAVRALTDHLDGDVYFRGGRPGRNLKRFRDDAAGAEAQLAQLDRLRSAAATLTSRRS